MEADKIDEAVSTLSKANLSKKYSNSVSVGEGPYQANLKALKLLDIKNDAEKGEKELKLAISGIDSWIKELEVYRDAAKEVAKKGTATLRSS
jgi:hypothetical protein